MKNYIILQLFFVSFTNQIKSQTYIPFLLKNGNYVYMDSTTKKISNITGEMDATPTLFSKNGNSIISETKSHTRIIDKNGIDLFETRVISRNKWGNDDYIFYYPSIITDDETGKEHIVVETFDRSKKEGSFERYPGHRFFRDGKFSNYFRFTGVITNELTVGSKPLPNGVKIGFYNTKGDLVIPDIFDEARSFKEHLSAVYSSDYRLWGFINTIGEIVIPLKYRDVSDFKFGLSLVLSNDGLKYYLIDKKGGIILSIDHEPYYLKDEFFNTDYKNDSLIVIKSGKNLKIFDIKGNLKITVPYLSASFGFNYGTLIVRQTNGSLGLIDTKGKILVNFGKYQGFSPFYEGRAAVLKDGLWGFIDVKGNEVIKPQYYEYKNFSDGLALVKKITGWYFINNVGKSVIGPIRFDYFDNKYDFNEISNFKNGLAYISNRNNIKRIYFDKTGYFYVDQ